MYRQGRLLYELERLRNPVVDPPTWLSQTFAFTNLDWLEASDFFVPYQLNEPFWSDGAIESRWGCVATMAGDPLTHINEVVNSRRNSKPDDTSVVALR